MCYRFRAGHFIASYFSAQWPLVCFCINHHLLHKEAAVMKAERFINPGPELGPILDLQLCPKPVRSISYLFNLRTPVFTLLLCPEHSLFSQSLLQFTSFTLSCKCYSDWSLCNHAVQRPRLCLLSFSWHFIPLAWSLLICSLPLPYCKIPRNTKFCHLVTDV